TTISPNKGPQSANPPKEIEVILSTAMRDSSTKMTPLYLFPRRCYDRLTRDLIESGSVFCSDYDADKLIHPYDRVMLPLINDSISSRGSLTSLLRIESSLMEYGSCDWMMWIAQRLKLHNYSQEVFTFYHRIVAEREYTACDEKLIRRLREALASKELKSARSSADKMGVDGFVNATMGILNRGDRLVQIEPPFKSVEAAERLAEFIRSRRIPSV
ncbi:hypothetical protein PFISCL1PPCAC_24026, partial [Pristionchus fissidentatus]